MRSIWSGAISFGLVNIPVQLYSASGEKALDFDLLAKPDLARVKYKKVAATDGREVSNEDIVKGFEIEKGRYVLMEEEDFEKANVAKNRTIEILHFVKEEEIDPIYYEKPYYLEPNRSATKPYALLREVLRKTKKNAIARYVLRNREHIAALKTVGDVILLDQMRYYQDVRDYKNLNLPSKENVNQDELGIAEMLVNQLTTSFNPENYHDTYTEELQRVIRQKASGQVPFYKATVSQPTSMDDLMATLKASLEVHETLNRENRPPAKKKGLDSKVKK